MHPVVPRSSATQTTEEVAEAPKDPLPFGVPAVPRPLRTANAEAGPSHRPTTEDGTPITITTAPTLSAAFLAQDTSDPSLDFSIPEDGLPTRDMVSLGGPGRPAKYTGQQEAADKKNAERRHKEMVNQIENATFGTPLLGRPRRRAKVVDLSEFGVPTWKRQRKVNRGGEAESSTAGRGSGSGRGRGRGRTVTQETTPSVGSPLTEMTPGSPLNAVSEMGMDNAKEEGDAEDEGEGEGMDVDDDGKGDE